MVALKSCPPYNATIMKQIVVSLMLVGFVSACSPAKVEVVTSPQENQAVDWQAGIAIFVNGLPINLRDGKYHNLSEKAFLTNQNPGVVFIKKTDVTWGDFFKSLNIGLTQDCVFQGSREQLCEDELNSIKYFVNGQRIYSPFSRVISDSDRMLVSYGSETGVAVERQLNQVAIPYQQN